MGMNVMMILLLGMMLLVCFVINSFVVFCPFLQKTVLFPKKAVNLGLDGQPIKMTMIK